MQLEDYFEFRAPDDIRLKGLCVGIETILYNYLHRKWTPEEIARNHPTVSLEQVYATILYYLHNRQEVERYLNNWLEWNKRLREEQVRSPHPGIIKLRAHLKQREGEQDRHRTAG
ncbi:MAG: DUF433 domain-containing protein [Chloroflexota bacterium]|nr:DUF433 domain-containing protein [Chloroflexota bacterium]